MRRFVVLACVGVLGLAACEEDGPAERAGERIDDAIDDARDRLDDAADELDDAADELRDALREE